MASVNGKQLNLFVKTPNDLGRLIEEMLLEDGVESVAIIFTDVEMNGILAQINEVSCGDKDPLSYVCDYVTLVVQSGGSGKINLSKTKMSFNLKDVVKIVWKQEEFIDISWKQL